MSTMETLNHQFEKVSKHVGNNKSYVNKKNYTLFGH